MLKPIIIDGKLVYEDITLEEKNKYFNSVKEKFTENQLRLINPKEYYVDLSKKLYDLKLNMLYNYKR